MADKTIGELPSLAQLNDNSLIPVEQSGVASKLTGAQFKQFAVDSVSSYTERAETAAGNAADSASAASGSASGAANSASAAEGSASAASGSAANAANSATAAAASATSAAASKTAAETAAATAAQDAAAQAVSDAETLLQEYASDAADSAEDSEAWAVGQRSGQDVPSSDETYHNNAKYWAAEAQAAAAVGVSSFNGRSGTVNPQSGDYTAAMVGAAKPSVAFTVTLTAAGWSSSAQSVSNGNFKTTGYAYTVAAAPTSYDAYCKAGIYALDVTTNGTMTFRCKKTPTANIEVHIIRNEVAT